MPTVPRIKLGADPAKTSLRVAGIGKFVMAEIKLAVRITDGIAGLVGLVPAA